MTERALLWFRRDLRLEDHKALSLATELHSWVAPVFVFDTTILSALQNRQDRRLTFIWDSLQVIQKKLAQQGKHLIVLHGDPRTEIPRIAKELGIHTVFTNEDYEPQAKLRDQKVQASLQELGIQFRSLKDQVIFSGSEVLKSDGTPYQVFTPYSKAWIQHLRPSHLEEKCARLESLAPATDLKHYLAFPDLAALGFQRCSLWLEPGADAGLRRLKQFIPHMSAYAEQRDFPQFELGTSGLSVHLRFGTVSIRQLLRTYRENRSAGARVWLSELIWREFYQMLLDQFPHVETKTFRPEWNSIVWPGTSEHLQAWQNGETGYPIVDAAMRHFNETGWMHNRLRMIVASFLTKDLLIDWRKGEAYFASGLLDFDLAANNGGWQWCASTGCDAQPYFRIFNPTSQSLKFDPQGKWIRAILPELRNLSDKEIHEPWKASVPSYPAPIVDHAQQRPLALALYEKARKHK